MIPEQAKQESAYPGQNSLKIWKILQQHGKFPGFLLYDYPLRVVIIFLISPMARAGFKPLGQAFVQFMIVWQRYRRKGSSS